MPAASLTGITAVILYTIASLVVYRTLGGNNPLPGRLFRLLGTFAVVSHGLMLWQLTVSDTGIRLGIFPMASLITGTGAALVVISSLYRRLEWVSAMVFPLSALTIPPVLWIDTGYVPDALDHGVAAHVLLSILAYAVLAIATAQAVLLLIQHRQLKEGHIRGVMRLFPPIQITEKMLFELLWAGFLLLTAAILTGFVYLQDLFAQQVAHKTVITLFAWVLFASLLAGRHLLGWRAVTAVRLTIAGFALLLLGFFGSRLVLEILLSSN